VNRSRHCHYCPRQATPIAVAVALVIADATAANEVATAAAARRSERRLWGCYEGNGSRLPCSFFRARRREGTSGARGAGGREGAAGAPPAAGVVASRSPPAREEGERERRYEGSRDER
jgi:hypothetical protein